MVEGPTVLFKNKVSLRRDRKSTRLNSSHGYISYAVFCLKKKKITYSVRLTKPSGCSSADRGRSTAVTHAAAAPHSFTASVTLHCVPVSVAVYLRHTMLAS